MAHTDAMTISHIATLLRQVWHDQSGVSAIEYAFLMVMVSMAGVSALGGISDQLQETFNTTSSVMGGGSGGGQGSDATAGTSSGGDSSGGGRNHHH
ncbi:MAG: hypothetical protein KDE55_14055 [Novosphingobium sp.]|nr:hypothetical protein [Novosphingobium sp.]